jgi:hypothetical protein
MQYFSWKTRSIFQHYLWYSNVFIKLYGGHFLLLISVWNFTSCFLMGLVRRLQRKWAIICWTPLYLITWTLMDMVYFSRFSFVVCGFSILRIFFNQNIWLWRRSGKCRCIGHRLWVTHGWFDLRGSRTTVMEWNCR